jgi:hypothetical protein
MLAGKGQMRLTYTTAAFTHHGVWMPGVPVLLNDDMAIVVGPQRWLFYIALDRGRTRSGATWRSYAGAPMTGCRRARPMAGRGTRSMKGTGGRTATQHAEFFRGR